MKNLTILIALAIILFAQGMSAQVPVATQVAILKAEDARDYNALKPLMFSKNVAVQKRAILAAGRIGNAAAIPDLVEILESNLKNASVLQLVAFAVGEIESIAGADIITLILKSESGFAGRDRTLLARAVEAAGKIAAANPNEAVSKDLGLDIVRVINDEREERAVSPSPEVIRAGATAILRARPEGGAEAIAAFLSHSDSSVVADALNALSRLRFKGANEKARELVAKNREPIVRANAARLLGAAEDAAAVELLIEAATTDADSRVRVSAIRSLAALKNLEAIEPLLAASGPMLKRLKASKNGADKSELLEVATSLSRLAEGQDHAAVIAFLQELRIADGYTSGETESAFARVSSDEYLKSPPPSAVLYKDRRAAAAYARGMQTLGSGTKDPKLQARAGMAFTTFVGGMSTLVTRAYQGEMLKAMPDAMQALAALKPGNLEELMRSMLTNDDAFIRTAAAGILADLPASKENVDALSKAWSKSFITDKTHNDAVLAILDALYKLDKKRAGGALLTSLNSRDFVVRKKALELLATYDEKEYPGMPPMIEAALEQKKDQVFAHQTMFGTRLGQVLNNDADYRRAASRKNGSVKAVFTTPKDSFTIDLLPEDAPLTVDNFVKLANAKYFDGLEVHRVVPNFVMQDGDPIGNGSGGPGWSIRCEVNMLPYGRGAVGMALSGKDTGGSQWFVTHSPQPHLDGGYTVFGQVNETDMKVVDNIVRGDKLITVRIVGR